MILDVFLYKRWRNNATFDPQALPEQIRREISKTTDLKELINTDTPGGTRKAAIGSLVLGLASLLFNSFNMGFGGEFAFIFLPAFFSILLGVTVIRAVQSYQNNRLDFGLAVAGILAGIISGVGLFTGMM